LKQSDRRNAIEQRRNRRKRKAQLTWGLILGALIIGGGLFIWRFVRPAQGVAVPIEGNSHVLEGEPVAYESNPPTSGEHYDVPMLAGFYDESSAETKLPYPEGYLIHSLEHGYIVFWYNCEVISETECSNLKSQVKEVIGDFNEIKLIAFPWNTIDVPLIMTSWGRMLAFEEFDPEAASQFIKTNRLKAPEPDGL